MAMEFVRPEKKGNKMPSFLPTLRAILREGGVPLAIILLTALAVKIFFQIDFDANNPLARHPISDERLYIETADRIAAGQFSPGTVFHSAPLYPYLIAPLFAVCGSDPMVVRLVQALLGTGSILLLYLLTRFFLSRSWALAAALAMLLYYPFTFFEGKVLIVSSTVFFLLLSMLFLVGLYRRPGIPPALCAGIAMGVVSALRPNLILLLPAVVFWIVVFFKQGRRFVLSLIFLVGAAGPIAPFTLHNYVMEDDFILLSDNGGINFYFGNNPSAGGSFRIDDPLWGHIEHQHFYAKEIAEADTGENLKPSQISNYWMRKGLSFIQEHPLDYLNLLGRKFKSFLDNFEYGIIYTPPAERDLTWILGLLVLPYGIVVSGAFLGLAALALSNKKRNRMRAGDIRDPSDASPSEGPWALVVLILAVHLVSVLLFFNYSRFRLTALPLMILLGLNGCCLGAAWIKSKNWGPAALCAIAAGTGLLCSLAPSPWKSTERPLWELQFAHGYATVGTAFSADNRYDAADQAFTRALEIAPEMDLILSKRGRMRLASGNYQGARDDLEEALALNPDNPLHLANMADFYMREGAHRDLDRAAVLIRQALSKPGQTSSNQVYLRMIEGNIRMERGEYEQAISAYNAAHSLAPSLVEALYLQGVACRKIGKEDEAGALFRKCLEIEPGHPGALEAIHGTR